MSQPQLERKVADYLRKSQALEHYWQRPITAEQLQAEMDRMAKHTKQPEVLSELFEALGNDPFVIAECLARPALADRLVTNWYAYDQRIHGELKQRAEAELQTHTSVEQTKQLSGKYSEIELAKNDATQRENNRRAEHSVKLNPHEWDQAVQRLAAVFNKPGSHVLNGRDPVIAGGRPLDPAEDYETTPTGKLSPLLEDESRFYAIAVTEKAKDRLKLATVSWLKEPMESWLARAEHDAPMEIIVASTSYTLPTIATGACLDDIWAATSITNAPAGRELHTAVWTGSEMIVWGGSFPFLNTGGTYDPITDSWTATSTTNAPSARDSHTAVWTGSEMIVWGGFNGNSYLNTGGRYNPITDSWAATSIANAPSARLSHIAVWSGTEMIIWGGNDGGPLLNTGGRYNPSTDSWIATSTANAPAGREKHTAVWTGSQMIVWGGEGNSGDRLNTGGRYNPSTDNWSATTTTATPDAREFPTAVWTGSEMIVWGGFGDSGYLNTGGAYNPSTDSWTATTTAGAPTGRQYHTEIWTGDEMIIWGGQDGSGDINTGGRYSPVTAIWSSANTAGAPEAREHHTAAWTGSQMIVWGGFDNGVGYLNTGGRYCAQSGPPPSPTPTPCTGRCEPTPRPRPTPHSRPTPP